MIKSIFFKDMLPYIVWYALLFIATILFDYILHHFKLVLLGRYLGTAGTVLIILSFVYSLQKRKIINIAPPKALLEVHEILSWIGALMVMVHAGIHFNAILPWLAIFMLIITVASGFVGKVLLNIAKAALTGKKNDLVKAGLSEKEIQEKLYRDSIMVDLMKKWRVVHLPITVVFGFLTILHILSIIMFAK